VSDQETQLAEVPTNKFKAYRRRLVDNGGHQVVVALPRETVAFIDELKVRSGLRNRSQALLQLIELGRAATQTMT
jgi:hypothetical protein